MFCNEHNFSDNRPMGLCNPTRMVEHYFPQSSFEVVSQVHFNLGMLQELVKYLPVVNTVGSNMYKLDGIQKYLGDIVSVAHNLNNIITVHNELPLVQDLAPRLKQFTDVLTDVNNKIKYYECTYAETIGELNSKIKYLEDLYVQYEYGLKTILEEQMYALTTTGNKYQKELSEMVQEVQEWGAYFKSKEPLIKQYIENQESVNVRLSHLEASDAVNIWLYTQTEQDFKKALQLIKQSENYGNDETGNRTRLQYTKEANVFKIMADNSVNVTVDTGDY